MSEERRLLVLTRARENASFRQRVEPYLEALAARGIVCETEELSPTTSHRFRQMRSGRTYDGVLLHRKTATLADGIALAGARRLIYDFDDAVLYQARAPERLHWLRRRRFRRAVKLADLVIAGAPELARLARSSGARQVTVVPTGLDTSRYTPADDRSEHGPLRLVWIGSKSTLKQLAPLRPVFEALGREAPDVVLRIIADAPLDVRSLNVDNVPWQRDTETRLLAECDIGIAPLPDTPYTRGKCGFKILQYMAAELPVIASPVGVNAEYVRTGETGLLASSLREWVDAVKRLAADPPERRQFGRAGLERARAEFDFRVLAPVFCEAIEAALA